MEERLARVEQDLQEVLVRLRVVEQNQVRSDQSHKNIDHRFVSLEGQMEKIEKRFDALDTAINKAAWKTIYTIVTAVAIPVAIFFLTGGTIVAP